MKRHDKENIYTRNTAIGKQVAVYSYKLERWIVSIKPASGYYENGVNFVRNLSLNWKINLSEKIYFKAITLLDRYNN